MPAWARAGARAGRRDGASAGEITRREEGRVEHACLKQWSLTSGPLIIISGNRIFYLSCTLRRVRDKVVGNTDIAGY